MNAKFFGGPNDGHEADVMGARVRLLYKLDDNGVHTAIYTWLRPGLMVLDHYEFDWWVGR
jgi:hypothetical protein